MVGYDSREIAQNPKGVKRDFRLPLGSIFKNKTVRETTIYCGWRSRLKGTDSVPNPIPPNFLKKLHEWFAYSNLLSLTIFR